MRRTATILASILLLGVAAPRAQEGAFLTSSGPATGVLELFTSQGCSSCPPADALLKTYAHRKDLVAITLPVDYWDYLGWKDTLASARNTARQREYARKRGDGGVYTPQVVVNGLTHVVGSRASEIDSALASTKAALADRKLPLRVWQNGDAVVIQIGELRPGSEVEEVIIWLALVQRSVEVPVRAGENGGRSLTYYNVARELTPVGTWDGTRMIIRLARGAVMRPGIETCAVLLQQGAGGPIIGAAWMGL